ncbi:MAG: hypothetical protein Q9M24_08560 [Mariprofundaceae bacterium]|nr:hypothetical protein [Mariprofundaceae bacterium]
MVMALLLAAPVYAEKPSADARFDKTGDGLVDAEDWKQMRDEEKQAYAMDSLRELGLDPEAGVGEGKTRADRYLEGLRSVYGP